jgi:hypothetical protein
MSYYTFDINNNIVGAASDGFWNGEYSKIFTANVILANVDNVTGSQAQKNSIKANAYFIRAYSYWNLANYYCLPYATGNMQSQGLPLKKTTIYTESLQRATLQQTYDFILSDITAAQALVTTAIVKMADKPAGYKRVFEPLLSFYRRLCTKFTVCQQCANFNYRPIG